MGRKQKKGTLPFEAKALRHGFYSRKFQALEKRDLGRLNAGLLDEITMLRISIRRLFEITSALLESGEEGSLNPDQQTRLLFQQFTYMCRALSTIGTACTRLANMHRIAHSLQPGADDPLEELIQLALKELDEKESDEKILS